MSQVLHLIIAIAVVVIATIPVGKKMSRYIDMGRPWMAAGLVGAHLVLVGLFTYSSHHWLVVTE
jgi:hypothetical protein